MPKTKLPSFQFYPGDWLKDANLRRCSSSARGFWIDLLCIMFECEDRGVLATAGQPWTDEEIASSIPGNPHQNLLALQELIRNQVCRRNKAGSVYSKRLVSDEENRTKWRKRQSKHRDKDKNVTPSVTPMSRRSSSSSSSSSSYINSTTKNNYAPVALSVESEANELQLFPEDILIEVDSTTVVPADVWQHFVDHRKKLKKPLTKHTGDLIRRKLQRFKEAGDDPVEILEQAMINGWQGIWPLKGKSNGHESFDDKSRRESHEAINRVREGLDGMVRQMGRRLPGPQNN